MRSVALSPQAREAALEAMGSAELDVLVVGGGVVGCGAALDAATRGLSVGLVEARDFASPTPAGWIWPGPRCLPAALCAVVVSLPHKAYEAFERELPAALAYDPGETKECFLALFLAVYLLGLVRALDAARTGAPGGATGSPPPARR